MRGYAVINNGEAALRSPCRLTPSLRAARDSRILSSRTLRLPKPGTPSSANGAMGVLVRELVIEEGITGRSALPRRDARTCSSNDRLRVSTPMPCRRGRSRDVISATWRLIVHRSASNHSHPRRSWGWTAVQWRALLPRTCANAPQRPHRRRRSPPRTTCKYWRP